MYQLPSLTPPSSSRSLEQIAYDAKNTFSIKVNGYLVLNLSLKKFLRELYELEYKILVALECNEINEEKGREFQNRILSIHKEFTLNQISEWYVPSQRVSMNNSPRPRYRFTMEQEDTAKLLCDHDIVKFIEKKIHQLYDRLRRFIEPVNESAMPTEVKVNDHSNVPEQPHTTANLSALLQKQKFYIQMIESFASEGEIFSKEAELPESKVNDHFNRTSCPNVIVDFLNLLYKKQKSLIEQIELIESNNDPSAAEAETLHHHISLLYDSFVKNQDKIETYVNGNAFDKELEMSREILVKVISIQTRLKKIFSESTSLAKSKPVEEPKQMKESAEDTPMNRE